MSNKWISKLTLGLIAGALVASPLTYAGDDAVPVEQTKNELEAKKEEIKQDKAELKKDRADKRELRRKLHTERRAARKAKKELIKKDQPAQPVEEQPAQ